MPVNPQVTLASFPSYDFYNAENIIQRQNNYYFDIPENQNLVTDQYGSVLFSIKLLKPSIGYFAIGFS